MFIIPGGLVSIITFPGVVIHEWAHKKFCDWLGVLVQEVVYFRFGNPAGYVIHEEPKTYKQTFWISVGPLVINSAVTIFFSFLASGAMPGSFVSYLLLWVAISAGMHSFPSDHDMKNVLSKSKESLENGASKLHYLTYPLVWLMFIANKLRFFWFDLIYALILVGIGGGLSSY